MSFAVFDAFAQFSVQIPLLDIHVLLVSRAVLKMRHRTHRGVTMNNDKNSQMTLE